MFIEDRLKLLIPALSQAITIANEKKFVSVLLTLKNIPNQENNPTNDMTNDVLALATSIGSVARTLSDAANCQKFKAYIDSKIDEFNKNFAISNAQQ